jgi:4-nitrophenyl phosphatase
VQEKLAGFGVQVSQTEVLTSSEATAAFLRQRLPDGAPILAIGEHGLIEALRRVGFTLVDTADSVSAVVVALDRGLSYGRLMEASLAIEAGALFVATNPDVTYPVERGLAPGSGAILAALQATTGVEPLVVGKPEPHLFEQALRKLATPPGQTLGIGDRIETDIVGARRAGIAAALVMTGVTSPQALAAARERPDFVFDGLVDLAAALDVSPNA